MKKKICHYFVLLVCLLVLGGCEEEVRYGSKGGFSISLVDDLTDIVITKSTPAELGTPLTSQFTLQIKNAQTGALAYNGLLDKTYYEVPPATYDLFVSYGANPELAFDSPYYEGELANQVVGASGKNVVIPCSVANALVSVEYINSSIFDLAFASYGIVATVGDISVDWTSENAKKSIYLKAGSAISLVFKGVLRAGDREMIFPITQGLPETFNAKDHYILRLSYQAGQSKLNITTERKEATINETVPQDWLPKPSTASVNFIDKILVMKETMSPNAIIDLKVARPLQDLKFKLELEDPAFQYLSKDYTLSSLSDQDKEELEKAGVLLPGIGSSAPSIDMSGLVSKLQTIHGGQTVRNYISINPKANDRWNSTEDEYGEKYTIQVEKPEFKAVVYPGDIWTKEFTVASSVLAGNPEILIPEMKYEYSEDGSTWTEVPAMNVIKNLSPGNIYITRAKYRDIISENTEVKLYSANQVPNASMENWYYRTDSKKWLWNTYYWYTYYPQADGDTDPWWTTNNLRTTDWPRVGGISYPVSYASTSAVSNISDDAQEGTKCVEIRSMGSGSQQANTADICYDASKIAGCLYIGDYKWSDSKEEKQEGRIFNSRPTDFSFWYKYTPYGTDEFEAYIELQNRDNGTIIVGAATSKVSKSESDKEWIHVVEKIDYINSDVRITHMFIRFISSTAKTPSVATNVSMKLEGINDNWKAHVGSRLRVDNVSLIYDK